MATRVFELARELGVTSKTILTKCKAEGLPIKNHMTALSVGQEVTIREWFSEDGGGTAVETTEHVDLQKARAAAMKRRRRKKAAAAEETAEQAPAESAGKAEEKPAEEAAETKAPEEAEEKPVEAADAPEAETEEKPAEEAAPDEEKTETEKVAEPAAEAVEAIAEEETAETSEEEAPAEVAAEAKEAEEEEPSDEKQKGKKEKKPKTAAEEVQSDSDEDVAPAGPQVVPKPAKLRGPKVVRVEKPEYVPLPRNRRRGGGGGGGAAGPRPPRSSAPRRSLADEMAAEKAAPPSGGGGGGAGAGRSDKTKKKPKRRSPRRRSGRAESGEKLREWRQQDLLERSERLAAATGGLRRHRPTVGRKRKGGGSQIQSGKVEIDEPVNIKDLSAATGIKGNEIIRKLMGKGQLATINQVIDTELAEEIMLEYGIELLVTKARTAEEELIEKYQERDKGRTVKRAPVVTFLGHVDHGKTSLLDYIRQAQVASGEAGGITQHIGSYRFRMGDMDVTFLDTPGHEAFTAMRARGANMTDVVVLVVAADDGVMPQTVEAINHAKAAKVPIVVALNKIDVPNANPQRALAQLAEHELAPQAWGGNTEVIETSAETGQGIEDLVETLTLEAELLDLQAEPEAPAQGFVIESRMDPGRGVVATLLVKDGTLRIGDNLIAGKGYGRVRAMIDDRGSDIQEAGPSTPVEVSGLSEVPTAGDRFFQVEDVDEARRVAEERRSEERQKELASSSRRSLEDLLGQIEAGETNELAVIVKADVQGSIEALRGSLEGVGTDEAKVNLLSTGVGAISTSDVSLAEASDAVIIGFNVVADAAARQLAEQTGVEIRTYRVIYHIIEDIRTALEEGLAPEIKEETIGRAEVRQTFKVSRLGTIAGCYVTDGVVNRNAKVRITRAGVVIEDERELDSLKRYKDDVREVRADMECGLKIAGYNDIKEGDILEFYKKVEVARKL
ncbi:MAG: translation initiation factor IF-2 [Phycisphaerae bacterium]